MIYIFVIVLFSSPKAIISCGSKTLFPDCSYCPKNTTNSEDFCKGHCQYNVLNGKCELKGGYAHCNLIYKDDLCKKVAISVVCSIIVQSVSDVFTRIDNSFCRSSNLHGSYNSLLSAKIACISDDKCVGIYETYHRKAMTLQICRSRFITSYMHTSVIHQRAAHISSHFLSGN